MTRDVEEGGGEREIVERSGEIRMRMNGRKRRIGKEEGGIKRLGRSREYDRNISLGGEVIHTKLFGSLAFGELQKLAAEICDRNEIPHVIYVHR